MLEIDEVAKTYPNGVRALERLSLRVESGEILAIVGGSGCGKSTLLRIVSGLERASGGAVRIDGETVAGPHPHIGFVFQEPRLLPWLTIEDNVGFGLEALAPDMRRERVGEALERVGLAQYAGRWPRELSGGQSQRVALARALVARPQALLLDEPFSALDAFTRADLQDHLLALWSNWRPTLILVTHDMEEALVLADRVVVLRPNPGRVEAIFDVESPRPRDRLSDAFNAQKRRVLGVLNATLKRAPAPADA